MTLFKRIFREISGFLKRVFAFTRAYVQPALVLTTTLVEFLELRKGGANASLMGMLADRLGESQAATFSKAAVVAGKKLGLKKGKSAKLGDTVQDVAEALETVAEGQRNALLHKLASLMVQQLSGVREYEADLAVQAEFSQQKHQKETGQRQ